MAATHRLAPLALCLLAASALRLQKDASSALAQLRQAALREGDVVLRGEAKEILAANASAPAKPSVHVLFAFDTWLGNVKRRVMVRKSLEHLRRDFMDGEEGRDAVAWRFFSDDELPDVKGEVLQPGENRRGRGKESVNNMLGRWLFDLQWSMEHLDFAWLVRADDDGVLCPRNFARLTEGLRTLRPAPQLRAKQAAKPWLDSWTAEALRHMHEDLPRPVLVYSSDCRQPGPEAEPMQMGEWRCTPSSAAEQYRRSVRLFEVKSMRKSPGRYSHWSWHGDWEENLLMMSPEFVADLLDKVVSGPDCYPRPNEELIYWFLRIQESDCSAKKWPEELTVVNLGRADSKKADGYKHWGHTVWDASWHAPWAAYKTLKEYHQVCAVNDVVWMHHVDGRDLKDVVLPESLAWLDKLPGHM